MQQFSHLPGSAFEASNRNHAWLVQDGYADFAVLVDVGVPDLVEDSQLGRPQGVLLWKDEVALEEAAFVQRVRGTDDEDLKAEDHRLQSRTKKKPRTNKFKRWLHATQI